MSERPTGATVFADPPDVHQPLGAYSHTAVVPPGASLVFVSGQVGARPDGTVPTSFAEQAELVFRNIDACLGAHGCTLADVVKINAYLTPGQDIGALRTIRQRHLGTHRPVSTAVYVQQLADPVFLLEVEVVATGPAPAHDAASAR